MASVAAKVLSTVNAPYGGGVDAWELAARIADPASAARFDGPSFAFFSEVSPTLQDAFIAEMRVDRAAAVMVARLFGERAGYDMALAGPRR